MTEHTIEQTAQAFIEHLRQAGKKERTLYTYCRDLEQVGAFFGKDKPITGIQPFQVGKFFKSDALLKLANGSDRAERTVAKTVRVFRMMMIWAKETGRIETLPLPKSTPMGHSKIKAENDEQQ
jgi:site-specific recombinase XerD